MNDKNLMNKAADNIRVLAASMVEKAKSGHPGGAMGGADFINVLFSEFLVYDPEDPSWAGRDRFYLDPLTNWPSSASGALPPPDTLSATSSAASKTRQDRSDKAIRLRQEQLLPKSSSRHVWARRSCSTRFTLTYQTAA